MAALDYYNKQKQQQTRIFIIEEIKKNIPVISLQVQQEFYSACVARFGIDKIQGKAMMKSLENMEVISNTSDITSDAIDISMVSGIKCCDAPIVAPEYH